MTEVETLATERLIVADAKAARRRSLRASAVGGQRQRGDSKGALGASLDRRAGPKNIILSTRHGFHGKKGLAGAVTGSEADHERDPRVRFIGFPARRMHQRRPPHAATSTWCRTKPSSSRLWDEYGSRICCLITEPYLGGGGSFHPQKEYIQLLERFCREHDIIFILDEVQANFGRTGSLFAFTEYGVEPDIVVLGKGLGNGVAGQRRGRPGRSVRQHALRRRLRHLERQPARQRRRAGHARRIRNDRRASSAPRSCRKSSSAACSS